MTISFLRGLCTRCHPHHEATPASLETPPDMIQQLISDIERSYTQINDVTHDLLDLKQHVGDTIDVAISSYFRCQETLHELIPDHKKNCIHMTNQQLDRRVHPR